LASEKLIKEMLAKDKRELAAFKVANKVSWQHRCCYYVGLNYL